MKKLFLYILLKFFLGLHCLSQTSSIKGKVIDAVSELPLGKATVYINNSTRGALTNDSGYFTFLSLPAGTYEIVISFVGYKTIVQQLRLSGSDFYGLFKLNVQQKELRELLILPNASRIRYLEHFKKNLLGYTFDAGKCIIKNSEAVQFVEGKNKNDILAYADEALEIENPVLGYTILFNISEVMFNTATDVSYFYGYTRFYDWMDEKGENKKWIRNRKNVYLGSSQHFFRSLINKRLIKEGYMINSLISGLDPVIDNRLQIQTNGTDATVSNIRFSGGAFSKPLSEDSILKPAGSDTYELQLNSRLYIKYRRNSDLKLQLSRVMQLPGQPEIGTLTGLRLRKTPLLIDYRGVLLTPINVFMDGVWVYERLANMLPIDYDPEK